MQKQRNYLEKKLKTPMNKDYNYFWKQKNNHIQETASSKIQ